MIIYYKNAKGEKINLTSYPYRTLTNSTLFNYAWKYGEQINNPFGAQKLSKNIESKPIQINVQGETEDSYLKNIDKITSFFDADVMASTPGRLYVNNYYINCYIYSSNKTNKYLRTKTTILEFSVADIDGYWKTTDIQKFGFDKLGRKNAGEDLDYPIDYTYDYVQDSVFQSLTNDGYAASNFEITIYGRCENPIISIGKWNYGINNVSIETGEKIVINSVTKKIYKVDNRGKTENLFHKRLRDFYAFEKIPVGIQSVGWNGGYRFDVELFKERSEPKWI